jgi:putative ABC transport system permease protein
MSFFDLFTLILDNLGRRKARVALTAIGVVIGTAAVVVLVSLAIGLQRNATEQLMGIGDLTIINVSPNFGEPGPGPAPADAGGAPPTQQLITNDSLAQLAAIPGVSVVVPRIWMEGEAILTYNRLETWAGVMGMGLPDLGEIDLEAQAGTTTLGRGALIIGSQIPNNFYSPFQRPGQEMPPPPDLLDQQVKMVLRKYDAEGNMIQKTVPVRVVGILAENGREDWSMYMPVEDVTAYNEWFRGARINRDKEGYPEAIVKVASLDDVLDITDQIRSLGYQAYTSYDYVSGINSFYTVLQVVFGGVGGIALLVAAIGIANTMAMAILERTREIGLMKAIGATNRDVLSVFLGEAAGIGFLGGLGGVLVGWSAGQLLNVLAVAYLARQSVQTGAPPPSSAVFTPLWLPLFALAFATLIGLLSGLYPALRAANLVPVNALKYE